MTEDPKIRVNDFMLVKIFMKKTTVYDIGKVEDIDSDMESYIQFMYEKEKFHYLLENDFSVVEKNKIIIKLPQQTFFFSIIFLLLCCTLDLPLKSSDY